MVPLSDTRPELKTEYKTEYKTETKNVEVTKTETKEKLVTAAPVKGKSTSSRPYRVSLLMYYIEYLTVTKECEKSWGKWQ